MHPKSGCTMLKINLLSSGLYRRLRNCTKAHRINQNGSWALGENHFYHRSGISPSPEDKLIVSHIMHTVNPKSKIFLTTRAK